VGSGNSFHNLPAFFRHDATMAERSERFDAWLSAAVRAPRAERERLLREWASAPEARACHPREEHLIPLMVAAGAAGADRGRRVYSERVLEKPTSGFQFG
jgi:aromatic ring-opening dioxygenase catalytic subunit (LigB family)